MKKRSHDEEKVAWKLVKYLLDNLGTDEAMTVADQLVKQSREGKFLLNDERFKELVKQYESLRGEPVLAAEQLPKDVEEFLANMEWEWNSEPVIGFEDTSKPYGDGGGTTPVYDEQGKPVMHYWIQTIEDRSVGMYGVQLKEFESLGDLIDWCRRNKQKIYDLAEAGEDTDEAIKKLGKGVIEDKWL